MCSPKTNIIILLTSLMTLMTSACSSRHDEPQDSEDSVMLSLKILPLSAGSDGERPLKSDCIHEIRVVIFNQTNKEILVNQQFSLGGDTYYAETPFYNVKTGDSLQVYLLANCEGIDLGENVDLGESALYTSGRIDNLTFIQRVTGADNYVPMTRKETIVIPSRDQIPEDGKYVYPEPLYVVRTANKLTVSFTNETDRPITIKSYSIGNVNTSGTTYLMPNVSQQSWFDILKSTATGTPLPNTNLNWIHTYTVPAGAKHEAYSFNPVGLKLSKEGEEGSSVADASWLFAESRDSQNLILGGFQTYQFSVVTDRGTYSTDSMNPKYLENLFSLFRNTDVRINVTFGQFGVHIDVQPYQQYEVGVDFGLMRNNLGDLMVLLDNDGEYSAGFTTYLDNYSARNGGKKLVPVKSIDDSKEDLTPADGDYYAIHVGSDGDIYSANTEVWLMDADGCRVLSNFAQRDGSSDECNSRLVEYFPTTSPESVVKYRKDAERDIRLQHHTNHSCVVLKMDGMMYFKEYAFNGEKLEKPEYYRVESWEGSWDPETQTSTHGVFYVETTYTSSDGEAKTCYRKYDQDGTPTDEYVYPE